MTRRPRAMSVEAEEAPPEADRLEGFAHPRETFQLLGQAAAERILATAFAAGRMHHAWLLTGAEGIGKATLAYRFARRALSDPTEVTGPDPASLEIDPQSRIARQVRALSHPGLLVIRRPWQTQTKRLAQSIPVDEVRRIKDFLQLSAGQGRWRVVIVDRAEEMNASAANALLKSLEEPPPCAVFLLVSSEPGRLLPTIHSRCRRLELRPLSEPDLTRAVAAALEQAEATAPSAEDAALIASLANGSVRRALSLISGSAAGSYRRLLGILSGLPRLDLEAVHKLADAVAPSAAEQEFHMLTGLLQELIARCLRARTTGEGALAGEAALIERLLPREADGRRLASWAGVWETIAREKADVMALNLDRKAFLLDTFLRIEAVSRDAA